MVYCGQTAYQIRKKEGLYRIRTFFSYVYLSNYVLLDVRFNEERSKIFAVLPKASGHIRWNCLLIKRGKFLLLTIITRENFRNATHPPAGTLHCCKSEALLFLLLGMKRNISSINTLKIFCPRMGVWGNWKAKLPCLFWVPVTYCFNLQIEEHHFLERFGQRSYYSSRLLLNSKIARVLWGWLVYNVTIFWHDKAYQLKNQAICFYTPFKDLFENY